MKIKFKGFDQVNQFIGITTSLESEISVRSGKYVVDAKSVMGIYSLDLSKELDLEIIEKRPGETANLVKQLETMAVFVHE